MLLEEGKALEQVTVVWDTVLGIAEAWGGRRLERKAGERCPAPHGNRARGFGVRKSFANAVLLQQVLEDLK